MDEQRIVCLAEREDECAVGLCQGVGQRDLPSGFAYLHGCGVYRLAVFGIGHNPFDGLLGRQATGSEQENEYIQEALHRFVLVSVTLFLSGCKACSSGVSVVRPLL